MNGKQRRADKTLIETGNRLFAQGRLDEAAAVYERVLRSHPDLGGAHSNLGNVRMMQGRLDEAIQCYRRAVALAPGFAGAHSNLGAALQRQGFLDEAAACHRRALALMPTHPQAHNNLGNVRHEQGRPDEAAAHYQDALALNPDFAEAHNNLGLARKEMGRLDEAVTCYRRALALRPDYAEAHYNLAAALLHAGAFEEGWREHEWRWRTPQMVPAKRGFHQPQWRGEAGGGRTVLLHAEQGLGDTLQFCRYAPLAAARGWRVVMEVQKPLVRLLGGLAGVDRVIARGEALPPFDVHCPMLSLPLAFGTTVTTIPADVPYLNVPNAPGGAEGMVRIGVVWAGNPRPLLPMAAATDRRRSMPPEALAPLFDLPGVSFISLQKDHPTPAGFPLADGLADAIDFADTAAVIAGLDLVVSVDTAVAHLAGAMGKPVWLLDRFDPCWRWLRGRDDSPWYPTARIFRQARPGDWDGVILAVRAALQRTFALR